ncbi:SusD/RagB family nutrient-binding outer membrane lipoprotein [Chitinophaga rhizophila]|uniref:SusD/RagB family nutrient-binding outer membrane lipoprotein n=1 Tax=Chitinophaga rhizophila TaxID=2866212 RepID=A0ABS7GC53_9BACT|nr:SusD/RagB family nutrient-binding outer membrane lipoprotein [Chitinophaga rhizophila]MBW8685248.1 SusD/RagB family nutrient-binding outer membrane lipoprotein [Chitinophaga rhizophila]
MKKGLLYITLGVALFTSGCTKDFDEINTDPVAVDAARYNANLLLSKSQYQYANKGYAQLLFQSMWPQLLASTFNYYSNGDKYVASSGIIGYQNQLWNDDYRGASFAYEMTQLAKEKGLTNLENVGVIMKVLIMQHITDCYGDVPYSQALSGKTNVFTPEYDTQESIYTSMLTELDAAITKLDPAADKLTADLFYGGDIAKWKRFGYSLMLRSAMRLTKAKPELARQYAEKAASLGTFQSIADNAVCTSDNSTGNGNGTSNALLVVEDYREVKWSKKLIDYLRVNNDPRLGVSAEIPPAGLAAGTNSSLAGNRDSSVQRGLPNGYDLAGGATDVTKRSDYPGSTGAAGDVYLLGRYSRPTTAIYLSRSAPIFVLTYAETELLLAEAAVRGWTIPGTAAEHYRNGVVAALQSLATFSASATISAADANAYATAHPLDVSSANASLKMINEQYWATNGLLFNFIEAWINWRRSGYPVLTPVNYQGNFTGGTIPRRIAYQSTEGSTNPVNYQEAVKRLQGGDNYTSRVWWDAQ